jgi:hypothetical protein|nr:MAG TPA: hypothetical protein [Caudoviricetes sp.]
MKNNEAAQEGQHEAQHEARQEVRQEVRQGVRPVEDNRVEITIPRGDKRDDPNLFVSINGVNYLLPRGKTSLVPPEVAQEVRRSWEAERLMDEHAQELMDRGRQPVNQ